jgi:predicted PurR-regulated permease PerM
LLAYVAVELWPLFKLLVIAILLAVPLHRIVSWICAKGWPRWAGLLLASAILVGAIVGLFGLVGPMAYRQASALGKNIPRLKEQVVSQLPRSGPLNSTLEQATNSGIGGDSQRLLEKGLKRREDHGWGLVRPGASHRFGNLLYGRWAARVEVVGCVLPSGATP